MSTPTTQDPNKSPVTTLQTHAAGAMEDAKALILLAGAACQSQSILGSHHLVLPAGYNHRDITGAVLAAQPTPSRKAGEVQLHDLDSLLAMLRDQGSAAGGYVYADIDAKRITAVFNDHRGAPAGWRDHRAYFEAKFTPEFDLWLKNNRQPRGQMEFAEFIEDNFADITEPAAQQLLDVATTIQAKTDIAFSSARRLQDGQTQLGYTETIDARAGANGALQIPKDFAIGVRIFRNGDGYKLRARLKYRLNSGTVKFWYELDRPERAIEDAFASYVAKLTESSGYKVLLGKP